MKTIILAAGIGSRMRPLTDEKPKCLIDIAGKSFIQRQLDVFKKCALDDITVVVGYKFEMIKEYLKSIAPGFLQKAFRHFTKKRSVLGMYSCQIESYMKKMEIE